MKFSFLLPFYNAEDTLEEAVLSILNQTYGDFEVIAVDDGSTDRSSEIFRDYAVSDKRMVYLKRDREGITKALNAGLSLAKGEFIVRIDADDISDKDRLSRIIRYTDSADMILSRWNIFYNGDVYENILSKTIRFIPLPVLKRVVMYGNIFVHGTFVFRKSIAVEIGGYREKFPVTQDYDFLLRFMEVGKLVFLPDVLYTLRKGEGRISKLRGGEQLAYERLASYFAFERKYFGKDSYAELSGGNVYELLSNLEKKYKTHTLLVDSFAVLKSLRRGTPTACK